MILHCTTGRHKRQAGTAAKLQLILHCTTAKQKRHTGTAAQLQLILHCITVTPRQALQVTTDLSRPWLANKKLGSAAAQLQLILRCRNCCTASVDSALHYREAQSTGRNCCTAAVDSALRYGESLATGWNCCTLVLHCTTGKALQDKHSRSRQVRPSLGKQREAWICCTSDRCCTILVDSALHYREAQTTGWNCCKASIDSALHYSDAQATGWKLLHING